MAFVTSRGFRLPASADEMGADVWFSLWRYRLWPYEELREGDDLYWYETPSKRIVWRTRVAQVDAFPYESLDAAVDHIDDAFGIETDTEQPYLQGKPQAGYCLAYRVEALERLDLPKPDDLSFNQQGWERGSRPEIAAWLSETLPLETGTSGNPDWARDEIVLALDLFVRAGSLGGNPLPGKTDPEVIALSQQMTYLPIHPLHRRGPDFRNATGVALKLANFRAIDRDVAIERGESGANNMPKGMTRYSALDRSIFEEFYGAWDLASTKRHRPSSPRRRRRRSKRLAQGSRAARLRTPGRRRSTPHLRAGAFAPAGRRFSSGGTPTGWRSAASPSSGSSTPWKARHVPSCVMSSSPSSRFSSRPRRRTTATASASPSGSSWTTAASWTSPGSRSSCRMSPPQITGTCCGASTWRGSGRTDAVASVIPSAAR